MGLSATTYVLPTPFIRYDSARGSNNERILNSTLITGHAGTLYQAGNKPNINPARVVSQLNYEQIGAANTSIITSITSGIDASIRQLLEQTKPTAESVSKPVSSSDTYSKTTAQERVRAAYNSPSSANGQVNLVA